jgi:hypothetical protein
LALPISVYTCAFAIDALLCKPSSKPDSALPLVDFWLILYSGNSEKQPAIPLFFRCEIAGAPKFPRMKKRSMADNFPEEQQ